ncbi:hypothetical protein [Hymenobacter sp. HDW8]|uniref:hypothetical protein n=1 Tax=Hymenobacter sp. HDW8 TaxID=2714932 RepID=UPI00140832C5|nr:hypothetical protein [Hymenobacter sp. HDW8]QIL77146.1 hypothetical protein G7064_15785 [Hymenobacter sp. HDW8]
MKEIENKETQPKSALRDRIVTEWYLAATVGFVGCINLDLDNIINSDDDRNFLLTITSDLHERLVRFGKRIPENIIADIENSSPGIKWAQAPLVNSIAKVGVLFKQLLKGDLNLKSTSSLDYLKPEAWNRI